MVTLMEIAKQGKGATPSSDENGQSNSMFAGINNRYKIRNQLFRLTFGSPLKNIISR